MTRRQIVRVTLVTAGLAGALLVEEGASPPRDTSLSSVLDRGRLMIGIDPSYPPFENVDGSGHLDGFDVSLSTELSRRIGVKAQFVSIDFGSIVDGLIARKFDVIISAASPMPEDRLQVDNSEPYFDDGLVVIARVPRPKTLGIESGSDADLNATILHQELAARSEPAEFARFDDVDVEKEALRTGRVDGAIVDAVTAFAWARALSNTRVDRKRLTSDPYVVLVRADARVLLDRINHEITDMQADGFLPEIEEKWLIS